jgi:gliding motility-associated-like protein
MCFKFKKSTLFFVFLFAFAFSATGQTLIMNEVSNGDTGSREYVEFVVASNTIVYDCSSPIPPTIDIRGWIFDDNSGYHGTDGIAAGAVRFSQDVIWSSVPVGTIILIYNDLDRNTAIPPDDISMSDGNCRIIAPLGNVTLFESNDSTPGSAACDYPNVAPWIAGGNWNKTALKNAADCARVVNLAGCEVFSVCYGIDNLNTLIYFAGVGGQKVFYFNDGDPAVQSNWSSGSANPSPGDQTPGAPNNAANAAFIAQFNNGCVPITPINLPAPSVLNAGCTCTGSATASATGSIGPYTYTWYDASYNPIGQTTATATSLCAGTYNVVATSHIGCMDTASVVITSTSTSTVSVNSATSCAGQSVTLTATPSVAGGTYLWAPGGQATPSITVNPVIATTYSVTYTLSGCTSNGSGTVTVAPSPTVTVNSASICSGQNITLIAQGGTTYSWSTGAITDSIVVNPTVPTTYTVVGTTSGCSDTAISTVTINPGLTVTVNSAGICAGSSVLLTAVASIPSHYTWSTGATTDTITVAPLVTTSYTVTAAAGTCTGAAIATVTVGSTMSVNAGLNDTICIGGNTTLGVNPSGGGYSYAWSPLSSLNDSTILHPVASPLTTTTYTVTVKDIANGCSGIDSVTVSVDLPMSSIPSVINISCNGSGCNGQASANVNGGTPPYTYLWSNGSTSNSVTGLCANSYTVTTTDSWGCAVTADTTITQPAVLTASISTIAIPTCSGSCDGKALASAVGGTTPYNYSWNTLPIQNIPNPTNLCAGSYICTITDSHGCSDTASVIIAQPLPVTIAPMANVGMCAGSNATLTAIASGGNGTPYNYTWDAPGNLGFATGSSISVNPSVNTTYTVNASDSLHGCPAIPATVTVTLNTALTVTANGPISVCTGDTATLTALATGGNGGPYTYTWSPSGSGTPIQFSPLITTTYTVTATDGCGSTDTDIRTVSVIQGPTVNFVSDKTSGCEPLCVKFIDASTAPAGNTIAAWDWAFGDGSPDSTTQSPTHCYAAGSYNVTLTVTASNTCSSSFTHNSMILANAKPDAAFSVTPNPVSVLEPYVMFHDSSSADANYWLWNFGDGTSLSFLNPNPTHTYLTPDPGIYNAQLIVRNSNGCYDTTFREVNIVPIFAFYAPNAFSPNSDGINETFKGYGTGIAQYEIYIFDRWGNMCFYADDINKEWDGKANHGAEIAQEEVYVWKVRLKDVFGHEHKYIGSVTIVK